MGVRVFDKKKRTVTIAKAQRNPTFVDLFSGAGGLTLGFEQAGFENIFSLDLDREFNQTYKRNFPTHKLVEKDITFITESELNSLVRGKKVDVVIGGPPCQGFSMAGNIGRKFIDDLRNHLFKEFARVVKVLGPDYFVMENVARLYTHNKGLTRAEILTEFENLGYRVECKVLNTVDFGIAQQRRRTIFLGTKKSSEIRFPVPISTQGNVKDVIGNLPRLASGEASLIANHVAMKHSDQMLHKMSFVDDGGDRSQIPVKIRPLSGDVRKYIRYASNKPSICITGDMRKVFHYSQNRALTVRELAKLQSFPDNFVFEGSRISQQQQVGNAVPPMMGKAIARSIKLMISDDRA